MLNQRPLKSHEIGLLGLPFDKFSSFLKGPAKAPDAIRAALQSGAMNLTSETGPSLEENRFIDLGNLEGIDHPNDIVAPIGEILSEGGRVISLGGDHSLSYGTIKAHSSHYPHLNILHLDAHSDLYDEFEGNKFSHACPFARVMEENLAVRLVQVGIRTLNDHQKAQADRFGVEIIEMKDWTDDLTIKIDGPTYLSLDIDVLDPAFAPGISHHEPGGASTRQLIDFIRRQSMNLVGADLVEYNPERDLNGVTGMVSAKLLKEIYAKMLIG